MGEVRYNSLMKTFPQEAEELFVATERNAKLRYEGYKKLSKADKLRFLNIAQGSLEECRYYIILSRDLLYINIVITYNRSHSLFIITFISQLILNIIISNIFIYSF